MDGLADLNRAAGRRPFPWEIPGGRPWSKHTREALDPHGHIVLRRALTTLVHPRREPYRLRLLAALEVLWATGVTREGLVAANVTDIDPNRATITLTVNPPGRTEATEQTFPLPPSAQVALRNWLPVRADVITKHLREGPDHPSNDALFVTLRHTAITYPDGTTLQVPPGIRITGQGLERNYSMWARRLNGEHTGQPHWPVPTDLYVIARGGAEQLAAADGA
jgi:integrase